MAKTRLTRRTVLVGGLQIDSPNTLFLGSTQVVPHRNTGNNAISVLRVASNVADTQTVTIGARTFEFDRAADGVVAGNIAVTGHANDTPAAATPALVAAINADAACLATAVQISVNEILIYAKAVGAVALATTEQLAGANNVFDAATTHDGAAPAIKQMCHLSRVPVAQEVTLDDMHFVVPFTVGFAIAEVRVTADGTKKAWDGALSWSGRVITLNNAGAADWAATDTVHVVAFE